jgi:hypothetical protein
MAFSQKSCNFSVPGAGKTTIVYAAYTYLRSVNDIDYEMISVLILLDFLTLNVVFFLQCPRRHIFF